MIAPGQQGAVVLKTKGLNIFYTVIVTGYFSQPRVTD